MASSSDVGRRILVLVVFGIVFGYAEAATVIYIRASYEPIHQRVFPERARDDLFPLFTMEQWMREGPPQTQWPMEVGREIALMLMVALVALAVSSTVSQWFASFLMVFGVWDIAYYLWLAELVGWPHSLMDWDLVFIVPMPWVSPVLAPVIVAVVMVAASALFFWREAKGQPLRPTPLHWVTVLGGGLVSVIAFCWDWRSMMAGGIPVAFNWPLFFVGLAIGVAGFIHCLWSSKRSGVG